MTWRNWTTSAVISLSFMLSSFLKISQVQCRQNVRFQIPLRLYIDPKQIGFRLGLFDFSETRIPNWKAILKTYRNIFYSM